MIEHMVLFRVKSGTPAPEVDTMLRALRGLQSTVPNILELTCGSNTSERNQGFTHGLLVRFGTSADLEAYITHPEHQRVVAECIRPIVENITVVDYEA